jgi:hypothetical protein
MQKIKLTQNKFALVSNKDFKYLNQFKWYPDKGGNTYYVVRNSKDKLGKHLKIRMHQEIIGKIIGKEIDHRDGNGLNNQRSNLRICSHSENQHNRSKYKCNTSGYKGVSWHRGKLKWSSQIRVNGVLIYLGDYTSKLKAYEAYCEACSKYHGNFSNIK